jgi:serine O-acetyltransferase
MLRRYVNLFNPDRCANAKSLIELIVSDYMAYYGAWASPGYKIRTGRDLPEPEPRRRLALLFFPRVLHNPCMHATILIRVAMAGPRWMIGIWRTILIWKHSMDINPVMDIGPGLVLPHPVGILLGQGLRIGAGVTILHHVSIGGDPRLSHEAPQLSPVIGDGVIIYTQSIIIGPITIGDGAVIGARSWVAKDVEPGAVHTRRD